MKRKDTGDSVSPTIKRVFANNLRTRREALMSQDTFAKECGFDRTYVSQLERGVSIPSLEAVVRAAYVLGVTIAELTEGMNEIVPQAMQLRKGSKVPRAGSTRPPYAGRPKKKGLTYLQELAAQAGFTLKSKKYLGSNKVHVWACPAGHEVNSNIGNLRQRLKNRLTPCVQCSRGEDGK